MARVKAKVKQRRLSKKLETMDEKKGVQCVKRKRGKEGVKDANADNLDILSLETPNLEDRSRGKNRRRGDKADLSF